MLALSMGVRMMDGSARGGCLGVFGGTAPAEVCKVVSVGLLRFGQLPLRNGAWAGFLGCMECFYPFQV